MTAELLVVILLVAATGVVAGVAALILAALGPAGWLVIVALAAVCAIVIRFAMRRNEWSGDDLRDEWRPG